MIDAIPPDKPLSSLPRKGALRPAIEELSFSYRAFTARPDRILDQRGLGRVRHRILYFVGRNPQISVNARLGNLGGSGQAPNAPLRQAIDMRMVAMNPSENDRRVRQRKLTAAGAALETGLTETQMNVLQSVFQQACAVAADGRHRVMLRPGKHGLE